MQSLRLIVFEMNKQITSLNFIIITLIFVIFSLMQMGEIFHYPVKNDKDIIYLKERGGDVRDCLYIKSSPQELKNNSINYLTQIIEKNQMEENDANIFRNLILQMEKENLSFDEAYETLSKENSALIPWLDACKNQFGEKVGTVDEVNNNIKTILVNEGYNTIFSEKYVTYIQLISAFLILPLFLGLITKDINCNISEIVYVQPISSVKYLLSKYIGCLISLLTMLYVLGGSMNFYLAHKFKISGWKGNYNGFLGYYIIFVVPLVIFLSSFIVFLVLLLRKTIAVFPVYILYIIFNATQGVFLGHNTSNEIYKCIIRLISENPDTNFIIFNRIFYLILSVIFIICSCILYKNSRKNPRRAITL